MSARQPSPTLRLTIMIAVAAVILTSTFPNVAMAQMVSVSTEATTYGPGDQVTVLGEASRNTLVALQVSNPRGTTILLVTVSTDETGRFSRSFRLPTDAIEGPYTVTASQGGVTRSAVFNVLAGPVVLTIVVTPDKAVYKDETITVDVISNKLLQANPVLTISQANAQPFKIELERAATNQWSGRYAVQKGFDGPATLNAVGQDALGNKGSASKALLVDAQPPSVTISAPREVFEATVAASGTVDDASIVNVELFLNDQPLRVVPVVDSAWSTEVTFPYPGTHRLTVEALDSAGNRGTAYTTVTVSRVLEPVGVTVEVPSFVTIGSTATIWVQTNADGKPIVPTNLSASIIQPDGTEKTLTLASITAGVSKASFTAAMEGNYLVMVSAAWRGAEGTAVRSFQAVAPSEEIAPIIDPVVQQVGRALEQVEASRQDLSALLNLVIVAIALSVAAAGAAIAAVFQITRKLVLK